MTDGGDGDELFVGSETTDTVARNFNDLTSTTFVAGDRYGVLNWTAAAIINAFQQESKDGLSASDVVDEEDARARAIAEKRDGSSNC